MKILWWDISKTDKGLEVISLKEQQRIAKGLKYVTDGTRFKINGREKQLTYEYSESIYYRNDVECISMNYMYYYWDSFFRIWTRACGSSYHTEKARQ
jgi:hypothetical protein